jgi:hypothetical protein
MSKTILVGCRLPSGLTLDGMFPGTRVLLNGTNTSMVQGAPGLTHVDETEWLFLKEQYASHSAFVSDAVFDFKSSDKVADVLAVADDLAGVKTGFEGLDPNKPAPGLEPEDKGKLRQEMAKNEGRQVPTVSIKGAKNKAAAAEAAMNLDQ